MQVWIQGFEKRAGRTMRSPYVVTPTAGYKIGRMIFFRVVGAKKVGAHTSAHPVGP